MSRATSAQDKLTARVFNDDLGTDVTITPRTKTSSTDGGFSDGGYTNGSTSTVKGIPYSNATSQLFKQAFGMHDVAEGTVLLPHDASVSSEDLVEWRGTTYVVQKAEPFILGGLVIAQQLKTNEYHA